MLQAAGAQALAHALQHNTSLQHLDLRLNHVADDGASALCRALLRNATLLELLLAGNELTQRTAVLMAQVVTQNTALLSVDLSCNHLAQVSSAYIRRRSYSAAVRPVHVLAAVGRRYLQPVYFWAPL